LTAKDAKVAQRSRRRDLTTKGTKGHKGKVNIIPSETAE
jgi:hypothetical protein